MTLSRCVWVELSFFRKLSRLGAYLEKILWQQELADICNERGGGSFLAMRCEFTKE